MTTAGEFLGNHKRQTNRLLFRISHELHNAENLSFWMEVEDFKLMSDSEIPDRAKEIYDKYFDAESKYELNVPG